MYLNFDLQLEEYIIQPNIKGRDYLIRQTVKLLCYIYRYITESAKSSP